MSRIFNISADCKPNLHYMVDINGLLLKIKEYIDRGDYFTMNRARQYGKTTTLKALAKFLSKEYVVMSLDFQRLSSSDFRDEASFVMAFAREIVAVADRKSEVPQEIKAELKAFADGTIKNAVLALLFGCLNQWCRVSEKKVVLMIDEVDHASNNQVFLDFLALLRVNYIDRDEIPTFHSVILASVYDVKSLKAKIRTGDEYKTNSPWNIAADFDLDMSLQKEGIAGMLEDYEADHHTGMAVHKISELLYDYTSGYPFLVSRLCKLIDEKIAGSQAFPDKKAAWTKEGFLAAVRILLMEENTLFESLDNKLIEYPELKQMLKDLLLKGKMIEYVPGDIGIRMAVTFGFITLDHGTAAVSNRIFETRLYNGFLAESSRHMELSQIAADEKNQFIVNGQLDMDLIIQKFVSHYTELFAEHNEKFLEDNGRCLFLLYVKPIINGTGNYYIEARTRTKRRTDLIIDFRGRQEIVELKIWHGNEYNERGEEQLADYLESYHLKRGYMVSFNFNKKKQVGIRKVILGDKVLIEAVV